MMYTIQTIDERSTKLSFNGEVFLLPVNIGNAHWFMTSPLEFFWGKSPQELLETGEGDRLVSFLKEQCFLG